MAWILLVFAGALEVAWATTLPATQGLTRLWPTTAFVAMLAASMYALSLATRTIPLGTAYAVWVGIGALGTAVVGIAWHGDPATLPRLLFLALLVVAVLGLKATSGH
ncbi:quaternary ammonium compound-resistance protein SugE [Actinocorallia herbida]|uniref:Quaternary ammonium compound-resistance protein SugE n=1 Tax=Actinocorallia herbida TaxID=58109 RepID=A0A3N1CN29_9ACTN|nr:multidrug efflux SMR transporter [Actinocorallia herbida]ROO82712.1 quaternary ammonium compound-resistance protein SugE [Actinocorallia herbida]